MSLARAMTKRMKRTAAPEEPSMPSHSKSVKNPGMYIDRSQISLPVALLSTTNTLVYDAPDLATMDFAALRAARAASSSRSTHSADDSDASISGRSRASSQGSRDTLTDASSVNSSPTSPSPNHLSGYFPPPMPTKSLRKSASTSSLAQVQEHPAEPTEPVPALPQRALSHSKRAHVQLAHKRSLQHVSRGASIGSRGSLGSVREQRNSMDIFTIPTVSEESSSAPFAKELEQLTEVAEGFCGVARSAEEEADEVCMRDRGLARFCAADYMAEIQPLFTSLVGAPRMAWI